MRGCIVPGRGTYLDEVSVAELGQRVMHLRECQHWSQSELGRRSGVKQSTISRLEAGMGKRPSLTSLAALASTLGVSLVDLTATAPRPGWDIPIFNPELAEISRQLDAAGNDDLLAYARYRLDLQRRRKQGEGEVRAS